MKMKQILLSEITISKTFGMLDNRECLYTVSSVREEHDILISTSL